jgi:RNA polymerase sigma-70 factor (ECF subfamily)
MLDRFSGLVEEHQNRVYSYAYYLLGSREEAEDVSQEVLLRLWTNIETVEPEAAGAWLTRVTRNAAFDRLRRRRSQKKLIAGSLDASQAEPPTTALADDPEGGARAWDVQRHLRRALADIAEPQRSIVILREIQGLKYVEIAELLELPLNTVKTYLHRARRTLREQLREVHCYAATS